MICFVLTFLGGLGDIEGIYPLLSLGIYVIHACSLIFNLSYRMGVNLMFPESL